MTTLSTSTRTETAAAAAPRRISALLAEFENPAQIVAAAEKVRDAGYRYWDCHTPFPVHGLDRAMGIQRTILPVMVFFAGAAGCTAGLLLQLFTNSFGFTIWALVWVTGYPFLISGKPALSIPAFIPVMFELTILFSALSTVFLMLGMNGLPWLHHPLFSSERFRRASDDRFFISIDARDPRFYRSKTEHFLKSLGATAVEAVED
ncbi:MAG: hypothetical protein RI990_1345 [Planctomycetota bacterium]